MWIFEGREVTEDDLTGHLGFVYVIEHLPTKKKYVGQKKLLFKKTKTVKGKKKRILSVSDWKNYWGSNEELKKDVEKFGQEQFTRTIIRFCKSKGNMNYYELREQILRDVLLKPEEYYNSYVGGRIHRNHVKE